MWSLQPLKGELPINRDKLSRLWVGAYDWRMDLRKPGQVPAGRSVRFFDVEGIVRVGINLATQVCFPCHANQKALPIFVYS